MVNENASSTNILFSTLNGKEVTVTLLLANLVIFTLGFLALSLNAVVLDTLVKRTELEAKDLLICNLATTDMLTGVLMLYTVLYNIIYFQNHTECLVRLGAVFVFLSSSVLHLSLLTLDRFVQIVFPLQYPHLITKRPVVISSCAVWVFSVNYGLLPVYGWRATPGPSQPPCSFMGVLSTGYLQLGIFVFLFPVLFMGLMYGKIFVVARHHARAIAASDIAGSSDASGMKFARTVLLLLGTYVVCFLPMGTYGLVVCSAQSGLSRRFIIRTI